MKDQCSIPGKISILIFRHTPTQSVSLTTECKGSYPESETLGHGIVSPLPTDLQGVMTMFRSCFAFILTQVYRSYTQVKFYGRLCDMFSAQNDTRFMLSQSTSVHPAGQYVINVSCISISNSELCRPGLTATHILLRACSQTPFIYIFFCCLMKIMIVISMGRDCVFELRPLTGLFFICYVI